MSHTTHTAVLPLIDDSPDAIRPPRTISELSDVLDPKISTIGSRSAQLSNSARAHFAGAGLVAYAQRVGSTAAGDDVIDVVLGDMLGDVLHLIDALDLDADALLYHAKRTYHQEVAGEL